MLSYVRGWLDYQYYRLHHTDRSNAVGMSGRYWIQFCIGISQEPRRVCKLFKTHVSWFTRKSSGFAGRESKSLRSSQQDEQTRLIFHVLISPRALRFLPSCFSRSSPFRLLTRLSRRWGLRLIWFLVSETMSRWWCIISWWIRTCLRSRDRSRTSPRWWVPAFLPGVTEVLDLKVVPNMNKNSRGRIKELWLCQRLWNYSKISRSTCSFIKE